MLWSYSFDVIGPRSSHIIYDLFESSSYLHHAGFYKTLLQMDAYETSTIVTNKRCILQNYGLAQIHWILHFVDMNIR